MSKLKKIIIILSALVITIPLVAFGYLYTKMNSMYESNDSSQDMSLEEIEEFIKEDDIENNVILNDNITNILLIGSDGRTSNERGRSDAMMIATIDEKHKSIKLTSLARDTYVKIPGKGYEKLNHAYSYGGATLLMKTIESNFGVGISNYVNVNFASFIDIIDALGGITINVKSSELSELNKYIPECYEASNNKKNSTMKLIKKAGTQTLNGYQALSYSRIRKNDSAFERDARQRQVLQSLLNEVSTMSFGEVTKVANATFPYVKTNIKPMDMLKYIGKVLKIGNFNIKQLEFPIVEYSKGGIIKNKGWVLQFDSSKCLPILHKFIFEEEMNYSYINNKYDTEKDNDSTSDTSSNNTNSDKDNNSGNSSSSEDKDNSSSNNGDNSNVTKPNDNNQNNKPPITDKPNSSDKEDKEDNDDSDNNDESLDKPSDENNNDNNDSEDNPSDENNDNNKNEINKIIKTT